MTTVVVTRAEEDSARLVEALRSVGVEPRSCPLIRTEPVAGPRCRASDFDWVVFTSRAGVRYGLRRLEGRLPRVAAIGPGTEEALRDAELSADLVPSIHTQEGLVAGLGVPPGRVLFPGAADARRHLVEEVGARHLVVYRTVELRPDQLPDAELVVLASASAARALARLRSDLRCVTIGPATSAEARRLGLEVVEEAASSDLAGLVEAVTLASSRLPSSAS